MKLGISRTIAAQLALSSTFTLTVIGCSNAPLERPATTSSEQSLTGTLVETVGRDTQGNTISEHFISVDGKWTKLSLQGPVTLAPNHQVNVKGRLAKDGKSFKVESMERVVLDDEVAMAEQALSEAAQAGSVAVFLIKDSSLAEDPYPLSAVQESMFTGAVSTNAFFSEVSYGAFGLKGDVFGWYTADMSSCSNPASWLDDAMAQAAALHGFDTNQYRHAVAIYRRNGDGCYLAMGTVGRPDWTGRVWSFVNEWQILAHELGHNIGLGHANGIICRDSGRDYAPYGTKCRKREYYDPYDTMGYGNYRYHFNSYAKSLEGWLPSENILRATTAGAYQIAPHERAGAGVKSLLIPIPGTTDLYHVEAREQFGFDNESRFANAVLVRRVQEPGLGQGSYLIDMSPDGDLGNATMNVGQTFADPLTGVTIHLVGQQGTSSTVQIAFNGPTCSDGNKNGRETDIDCGGVCAPCQVAQACARHADCSTMACLNNQCEMSRGGLIGQYYADQTFTDLRVTQVDKVVSFDWGDTQPVSSVPSDKFTVRWSGKLVAPYSEEVRFRVDTDDGVRLWVNQTLIIDNWDYLGIADGTIGLTAGQSYEIVMEYLEKDGDAHAHLMWSSASIPLDLVPPTQLLPVCTLAAGADLGPRTTSLSVPNSACAKISQYPDWWHYGSSVLTLQAGSGSFPFDAEWTDSCTGATGVVSFTQAWQSRGIGSHTADCPVVVHLKGSGSSVNLSWY